MQNNKVKKIINFSVGEPSIGCFSSRLINRLLFLPSDMKEYYSYSDRAGLLSTRKIFIKRWGTPFSHVNKCFITHGTLGAIELIVRALKIDTMFVVEPTFADALNIFKSFKIKLRSIPLKLDGSIDFDSLNHLLSCLKDNGKNVGMYIVPTLNNPDGRCMDVEDRKKLVASCIKKKVICVEDDVYQELMYDDSSVPSLYELAGNEKNHMICRIFSMSKILMPGLRIAFVEANEEIVNLLVNNKLDFGFSPVSSYIAGRLLSDYKGVRDNIRKIKNELKEKNNYLRLLCMQNSINVNNPPGGYFLWIKIANVDEITLIKHANILGVKFTPGSNFYIKPKYNSIRICAATLNFKEIEIGVKRLRLAIDNASVNKVSK